VETVSLSTDRIRAKPAHSWRRSICALAIGLMWFIVPAAARGEIPSWLPRYDLGMRIDVPQHRVLVTERVSWYNRHARPAGELVFNAHAHYSVPSADLGLLAKTLEILRLAPSDAIDLHGPPLQIEHVCLVSENTLNIAAAPTELPFRYRADNDTALEVTLPREVNQGEHVTVEVTFSLRLPQRQGRWGQWEGVTFLAQWLPVLAFYDEQGWQPTPFIPWHQPFFNEAGVYTAHIDLPVEQKLACSGSIVGERDLANGRKLVEVSAPGVRDFSLTCSACYREYLGQVGPVRLHCFALPEHEFYAQQMIRISAEAFEAYQRWFGPYPYADFTICESYFGWNGNQCGGLVMIDSRIFGLPHRASNFVDELVSHEVCHQWWFNVVGVNGYAETWMDEGLAVYFAHRLMDVKYGRNNTLISLPTALEWLPNIHRDDYRYATLMGSLARGESSATVQEMPRFKNLVRLMAMTYDRGGKIVGMIEARLGEEGFFNFMSLVYAKYQYRILRVRDFQHELEAYTGRSWEQFFDDWLYGKGMTDWGVERVRIEKWSDAHRNWERPAWQPLDYDPGLLAALKGVPCPGPRPERCRVTVTLRQKGDYCEQTVLGFSLDGSGNYQVRIPVFPQVPEMQLENPPAHIEVLPDNCVRVEVELPCEPTQITVDPDQVLLDRDPTNNHWKPHVRLRLTPLYTQLDEVDLTNAYDRWNIIVGPWVYDSTYIDPWYTRSPMAGFRVGAYRTQEFSGGAYVAYRSDDRNVVAGVDAWWYHWPIPEMQVGLNIERALTTWEDGPTSGSDTNGRDRASRAVLFERYVFLPGSSFYLPPFQYVEAFEAMQSNSLPQPSVPTPGADPFHDQTLAGLHYHSNLLTPYWNPEAGLSFDVTGADGLPVLGEHHSFQEVFSQASTVKTLRGLFDLSEESTFLRWLGDSRVAVRIYGAAAQPDDARVFTLGGGELFRGYDLSQRQGSMAWVGSAEWRIPLVQRVNLDLLDHAVGVRNIYGAPFYDVGNTYLNGKESGPIAHAVGVGLRVDVAWFSLIERTIVRFDVAKTVNDDTPLQFWFGLDHPF
jgi:Peptidase family M1 domain